MEADIKTGGKEADIKTGEMEADIKTGKDGGRHRDRQAEKYTQRQRKTNRKI